MTVMKVVDLRPLRRMDQVVLVVTLNVRYEFPGFLLDDGDEGDDYGTCGESPSSYRKTTVVVVDSCTGPSGS